MMEQEVEAAVNWWTEQLRARHVHDVGDDSIGSIASLMGMMYAPLSNEQIQMFAAALKREITVLIEKSQPDINDLLFGSYERTVGTDYGPDDTIEAAIEAAGINGASYRLPMKTTMWIDPGRVAVRAGYGAEQQVIYQTRDEQKRQGSGE